MVGGLCSPLLAVMIMSFSGVGSEVKKALLTKSMTTPLALETAFSIEANVKLAAVFVSVTGLFGAIIATGIFSSLNIRSEFSRGVALGTVCHAIGTARAMQLSNKTGAYSGVALCLNGAITAVILPILIWWLG